MSGIRLSKLMAERGLCSRREADRLIEQGKVLVNGQVIDRLGSRFDPTVCIALAPEIQRERSRLVTVLLNKPPGVVSNQPEKGLSLIHISEPTRLLSSGYSRVVV